MGNLEQVLNASRELMGWVCKRCDKWYHISIKYSDMPPSHAAACCLPVIHQTTLLDFALKGAWLFGVPHGEMNKIKKQWLP